MKIILKCDVKNIGNNGETKEVASGFARNYLIPFGLAVEATKLNYKKIDRNKTLIEKSNNEEINLAKNIAEELESTEFLIKVKIGKNNKIFGAVTKLTICKILKDKGFNIKKQNIFLYENIKKIGTYIVKIKLHSTVIANMKILVANNN
ncbi:MAG: 50S ribosomal protein L9 [Endomicrobium sp.]|jgi:large subunit ribosomal protein L9|nr:50S ribosomal protein L9 [Endomicrobium sp.]